MYVYAFCNSLNFHFSSPLFVARASKRWRNPAIVPQWISLYFCSSYIAVLSVKRLHYREGLNVAMNYCYISVHLSSLALQYSVSFFVLVHDILSIYVTMNALRSIYLIHPLITTTRDSTLRHVTTHQQAALQDHRVNNSCMG
jgi:hypothetical protein